MRYRNYFRSPNLVSSHTRIPHNRLPSLGLSSVFPPPRHSCPCPSCWSLALDNFIFFLTSWETSWSRCIRECITSFPHRLRYFIFRSLRCVSSLWGVGPREGGGNQGKRRGRKRRVKTERKGGMFSELCFIMLPSVSPPDL